MHGATAAAARGRGRQKKVGGLIPGSELLSRGSGSKGKLSMKLTSALVEIVKNRLKE